MTKKHFKAFAADIRAKMDAIPQADRDGITPNYQITTRECEANAAMCCRVCRQFNPAFDAGRFYMACGLIPDMPSPF